MNPRPTPLSILLAIVALASAACSSDPGGARAAAADSARGQHARGAPVFPAPTGAYRVVTVANAGVVSGHVLVDGDIPAPTPVRPTADSASCDALPDDGSLLHRGPALENAVVWISDVRAGAPLPAEKRYAVTQSGCLFDPRVQGIVVGGTVNVRSVDPLRHTNVLLRAGTGDTVAVVRLYDAGSVVPDEHVGKAAGLVELRCEQHPWTRGWIAVFDHPYFAITAPDGSFRIPDVPPGKHTLMVWHERAGPPHAEQIEVGANGEAKVEVKIAVK